MTTNQLQDKCRGSLVGGAVGDALGYPIEFKTLRTILRKYGFAGISMYELDCDGIARFSDDTQMTLFTAVGLLNAHVSINKCGIQIADSIKDSYLNWYMTQTDIPTPNKGNWLSHIEPLWAKRAPGSTCLHSLGGLRFHSPNNNSKGCGGVMRVAPIGIFGAMHSDIMPNNIIALYAGESAKITHCHPMSTYSSMALAIIVAECIRTEFIDRTVLKDIITNRAIKVIRNEFNDNTTLELENLLETV